MNRVDIITNPSQYDEDDFIKERLTKGYFTL